jgi:DNA-binding CsgD family transcriptional regulator
MAIMGQTLTSQALEASSCRWRRRSLLALANSMSTAADAETWSASLRNALADAFPSVDRVSTNINRGANLRPGQRRDDTVAAVRVLDTISGTSDLLVFHEQNRDATHFADRFRRAGMPVDEYWPPHCENYSGDRGLYLGSIILWNKRSSPKLDTFTLGRLREIRPFLQYLFTSALARFSAEHLVYAAAIRSISNISAMCGLTQREREVILCRFHGKSVGETAAILHISESTVRRHLRSINVRLEAKQGLRPRIIGVPLPSNDAAK